MKRIIALALVAVMAICVFAGCGSNETASSSSESKESAASADKTTFTVGFDAEFPPYGYLDEKTNEYTGFDLELAQAVCDSLGWELKKQPIEWDSKDSELDSGTIDCIWNGFTINGREDQYTWSVPYVDNSQVVVVKSDSEIAKLDDLSGKVVAVQADSSALAALQGEDATDENKKLCESFAELQQIGNYNDALMNLDAGAVDAVCMDIGVASYNVKNNDGKYKILDDQISTEQYGIGFKKGNTELKDKVEKALMDLVDNGKFAEIAKKYSLEDAVCLGKD
ncbi:MAG: amino acid ABC transporter substrate-binding protein [Ruminococcus sp.]|nr:amino acid ABC transporter substrate-binding protein [Ruminococcus sp.]